METETTNGSPKKNSKKDEGAARARVSTEAILEFTCVNKSALLMDAMSDEDIENVLIRGQRKPADRDSPLEEMAKRKMYRGENNEIILPSSMLFACLRNAGRKVKVGKSNISTAKTTELPSILTIEEEYFILYDPESTKPLTEEDMKTDLRRCMMDNAGKKVAVGNIRPRFNSWGFKATISVDYSAMDGLTESHIRKLFEIAGNRIGVGSWRPSCNGPMGRFRVEGCEVKAG
ncbi:MAG: hypothetical protein ABIO72_02705 [Patescibacteria group bacterium]